MLQHCSVEKGKCHTSVAVTELLAVIKGLLAIEQRNT